MSTATASISNDVLITHELEKRPTHLPDYRTESLALHALAQDLASTPERVLSRIVHIARELCRAGSAGFSMLERDAEGRENYRWAAIAGPLETYERKVVPKNNSPCSYCQETNTHHLFKEPHLAFSWMEELKPRISETLYFPLFGDNRLLGCLWLAAHDEGKVFDNEDVRVVKGLAGFTSGALKMLRLVSSQQKSREEAEMAKTSYLNLLNSLSDVVVWESDPARNLSFISRSVERLFGYSRERWLGEVDFLSQIVHPEDRQVASAFFKTMLESSLSPETEFRCVASDSQVLWLKHKVDVVRDSQTGTVRQLRGTMTDISKSKQIEVLLREKEEMYSEVLNSLPVGVYICDAQARIKQWNARTVEIWGSEPHANQPEHEFYSPLHTQDLSGNAMNPEELPGTKALREGKKIKASEFTITKPNGEALLLVGEASPIRNPRGELVGAVCSLDESKSLTIEAELRAAQERLISAGLFNVSEATAPANSEESDSRIPAIK